MSKFKIITLTMLIMAAAFLTFSAFRSITTAKAKADKIFIYDLASDIESDFQDIIHWHELGEMEELPDSCTNSHEVPCYVEYDEQGFASFLSTASLSELRGISLATKDAIQ